MILERINGPEDIKKISEKELPTLAKEVRSALNSEFRTPNSEFRIKKSTLGCFFYPKTFSYPFLTYSKSFFIPLPSPLTV